MGKWGKLTKLMTLVTKVEVTLIHSIYHIFRVLHEEGILKVWKCQIQKSEAASQTSHI